MVTAHDTQGFKYEIQCPLANISFANIAHLGWLTKKITFVCLELLCFY